MEMSFLLIGFSHLSQAVSDAPLTFERVELDACYTSPKEDQRSH
jgi:hypothetical protein